MEGRCTSCHTTSAFVGTVTKAHADAGIGCIDCHSEHKGKDFQPVQAALNSCTKCHTDKNKKTYNGKTVATPHGGTLGYPMVNDMWKWKGLDADELAEKPNLVAVRQPTDTERQWRSMQFHALHIHRVRATSGMIGIEQVGAGPDAPKVVSCLSCHHTYKPIDRQFPRETCSECHSGLTDPSGRTLVAGVPNCISCHVQHVKDKRHWKQDLLVDWVRSTAGER